MLTLTRPDDWHVHLRDGEMLRAVVPATARVFGRAIVMPNLPAPVTTVALASAYRERIAAALPAGSRFAPLMTLYLTDGTSADEIARAARSGFVAAVKFYPAGATTNSASGVTSLERIKPAHYVFSGNGENGNPERESLEMLFAARGAEPFEIHLTYPVAEIDVARQADWETEQGKEKKKKAAGSKNQVRPNWSAATNSLAAFLKKTPLAKGQKVSVVDEKTPHVIDLLDPLGF